MVESNQKFPNSQENLPAARTDYTLSYRPSGPHGFRNASLAEPSMRGRRAFISSLTPSMRFYTLQSCAQVNYELLIIHGCPWSIREGEPGSSGVTAYVLGIGRALGGSRYAMQPVNLNGAPGE